MLKFTFYFLYHLSLCVPKFRKWHSKIDAPGRLLGESVNEEKLLVYLWRLLKFSIFNLRPFRYLKPLCRGNRWLTVRTAGVRLRIRRIKPVKPSRKFIITLLNLPQSAQAAQRCIESAKRYNEHDGLEIAPAIDKFQALDFFHQHGFTWLHTDYNAELGKDPLPEMGCFASHYLLWQRCIKLGEPIIVLEHDAIFRAPIPPLRFKHVILLSRPAFSQPDYSYDWKTLRTPEPREIFYPLEVLAAAHCYAITPEGAEILVERADKELVVPSDSFINKNKVDILYYHSYLVDFTLSFSTIDKRTPDGPTPEETWASYQSGG